MLTDRKSEVTVIAATPCQTLSLLRTALCEVLVYYPNTAPTVRKQARALWLEYARAGHIRVHATLVTHDFRALDPSAPGASPREPPAQETPRSEREPTRSHRPPIAVPPAPDNHDTVQ